MPRVSRGWIKQPLAAAEVAFHPSIRPSGKFHLRFCVCPTDFAEPVAEEQLRGQAPDAEPWLGPMPKPGRGPPAPAHVPASSTTRDQLVDVYANYISGELTIYVVPVQAKPLINILHTF